MLDKPKKGDSKLRRSQSNAPLQTDKSHVDGPSSEDAFFAAPKGGWETNNPTHEKDGNSDMSSNGLGDRGANDSAMSNGDKNNNNTWEQARGENNTSQKRNTPPHTSIHSPTNHFHEKSASNEKGVVGERTSDLVTKTPPSLSIGKMLREGRESQGLSIDQVVTSLKLTSRVVQDLEAECFDDLNRTFAYGYLMSYVRFLQLDERQFSEAFRGSFGKLDFRSATTDVPDLPVDTNMVIAKDRGGRISWRGGPFARWLLLALLILITIFAFIYWNRFKDGDHPPSDDILEKDTIQLPMDALEPPLPASHTDSVDTNNIKVSDTGVDETGANNAKIAVTSNSINKSMPDRSEETHTLDNPQNPSQDSKKLATRDSLSLPQDIVETTDTLPAAAPKNPSEDIRLNESAFDDEDITPNTPTPASQTSNFVVKISANAKVWVGLYDAQKILVVNTFIQAGHSLSFKSEPSWARPLHLSIGSAKDVRMTYNEKVINLAPHTRHSGTASIDLPLE